MMSLQSLLSFVISDKKSTAHLPQVSLYVVSYFPLATFKTLSFYTLTMMRVDGDFFVLERA